MKAILSLIVFTYLITQTQEIRCALHIINPDHYFMVRNGLLKKMLYEDIDRAKLIINHTKIMYNNILSKYYEINEKYYSLNEEYKTILETIVSLSY
jgi:hypothetical protein